MTAESKPNLYSFQKEGVERMLHFLLTNPEHACYNASEMGLGKCAMSLMAAKELKAKFILILCPAILRLVWADEIKLWYPQGEIEIYFTSVAINKILVTNSYNGSTQIKWTICSYDLSHRPKVLSKLESNQYDLVIYDEAHYLKSKSAKRTRAALGNLWKKASYRILLSGTPFTTRITDGFTAFHRCAPEIFKDFHSFADTYCYTRWVPWGRHIEYFGLKNADELSKLIRANFYLRYTKEEVLPELPSKTFQKISLPKSLAIVPQAKKEKEALEVEIELIIRAIEKDTLPPIPASLAEHRRVQGEAKIPYIAEFAEGLLEQEIPLVIYAWHKNVVHGIAKELEYFTPQIITGETPAMKRHEAIKKFQSGATNLIIANMLAAGTGITLTRSSTVLLAELDWSPAVVNQAIDRVHRISQKKNVLIYYFLVENSLDSIITNVVMSRAKQFKSVLNEKETVNGYVT